MKIVLLGAPGSGKGTQAKLLVKKTGAVQISTGDLLRDAVEMGSALGRQAKPLMDSGQLVPDEIVLGLIRERLKQKDTEKGFILDGFPRTIAQAEELEHLLNNIRMPLQGALLIDVDVDALIQRLTGRRTCGSCGQMYNIYTSPSKLFDRCDQCGGDLRQRADDNEETIGNRLRVYETQTLPLLDYYRSSDRLSTVHGVGEVDDIFAAVSKQVNLMPSEQDLLAKLDEGSKVTFDDLERKVLESVQHAMATANKQVLKPADAALQKAEKIVLREAEEIGGKLGKAAKKELLILEEDAHMLEKEAKELYKKMNKEALAKAVKEEVKILEQDAKVLKKEAKQLGKILKKAAIEELKVLEKGAKSLKKELMALGRKLGKAVKEEARILKKKAAQVSKDIQKKARQAASKKKTTNKVSKKTPAKKAAKKTSKKKVVKQTSKKTTGKKVPAKKAAKTTAGKKVAKKTTKKKVTNKKR